jgi:hypothetical protein
MAKLPRRHADKGEAYQVKAHRRHNLCDCLKRRNNPIALHRILDARFSPARFVCDVLGAVDFFHGSDSILGAHCTNFSRGYFWGYLCKRDVGQSQKGTIHYMETPSTIDPMHHRVLAKFLSA